MAPFAVSPAGEAASLAELGRQEVIEIPRGESVWPSVAALFERFAPEVIAINRGGSPIADGLSSTQYERMQAGLGGWMDRTTSAETLISEWLSVKTPEEVEIMRRAAALTAQWQVEAYAAAVPGVTTDRDIADMLEAKMRQRASATGGRRIRTRPSTPAETAATPTRPTASSSPATLSRPTSASAWAICG